MTDDISRRRFVKLGLLFSAGITLFGCNFLVEPRKDEPDKEKRAEEETPSEEEKEKDKDAEKEKDKEDEEEKEEEEHKIPRRQLGKTDMAVSIFSLGGSFIISREHEQEKAAELINYAIDEGVNYIDTAPTYGNSEQNIGRAIKNKRDKVYLASKTEQRGYDGVMREFEESLQRLQTDYIDLYQLHGIHSHSDIEQISVSGGALKALDELKKAGNIKYTGITGHKNHNVFLDALEVYDFDCALIPVNPGEVHEDSFTKNVIPVLEEKEMGIIAMKVAAYGHLFHGEEIESMDEPLNYVLTQPVDTAIIGISTRGELEENIRIAREFSPLSSEQLAELEDRVAPYQWVANFFKHQW